MRSSTCDKDPDSEKKTRRKQQKRDYACRKRQQDKEVLQSLITKNKMLRRWNSGCRRQIQLLKTWATFAKSFLDLCSRLTLHPPQSSPVPSSSSGQSDEVPRSPEVRRHLGTAAGETPRAASTLTDPETRRRPGPVTRCSSEQPLNRPSQERSKLWTDTTRSEIPESLAAELPRGPIEGLLAGGGRGCVISVGLPEGSGIWDLVNIVDREEEFLTSHCWHFGTDSSTDPHTTGDSDELTSPLSEDVRQILPEKNMAGHETWTVDALDVGQGHPAEQNLTVLRSLCSRLSTSPSDLRVPAEMPDQRWSPGNALFDLEDEHVDVLETSGRPTVLV